MAENFMSEVAPVKFYEETGTGQASQWRQPFIMMIRDSGSTSSLRIHTGSVANVQQALADAREKVQHIIAVLVDTIKAQKNQIDYNGYYTAYLLEQINEEEFIEEARRFALDIDDQPDLNSLTEKINTLLSVTKLHFTTQDLEYIFQCSERFIRDALASLSSRDFIEGKNGN